MTPLLHSSSLVGITDMQYHTWLSIEILCVKQNRACLVHTYRTMHYSFPSHSFCVLRGEPGFRYTTYTLYQWYRTQTLSPISESDWRFSGTRTISHSYSGLQHKVNIKVITLSCSWAVQVLLEKNLGMSSNILNCPCGESDLVARRWRRWKLCLIQP